MIALIDADVRIDKNGYSRHGKDKYLHRSIVERVLGKQLKGNEQIHHVDGNKNNNAHCNLVVCPDMKYHKLLHARQRILMLGGNPDKDKYCSYHKCLHKRAKFSTRPSSYDGLHNTCKDATNEYRKIKGLNKGKFTWKERLNQQYRRVFSQYTKRDICHL